MTIKNFQRLESFNPKMSHQTVIKVLEYPVKHIWVSMDILYNMMSYIISTECPTNLDIPWQQFQQGNLVLVSLSFSCSILKIHFRKITSFHQKVGSLKRYYCCLVWEIEIVTFVNREFSLQNTKTFTNAKTKNGWYSMFEKCPFNDFLVSNY